MAKRVKQMTQIDTKIIREDSLIKEVALAESDKQHYSNKIVFTTVNDISLVYYTNTISFVESLMNFLDSNFIITYEFAKGEEQEQKPKKDKPKDVAVEEKPIEKRIIKVKLPKITNK